MAAITPWNFPRLTEDPRVDMISCTGVDHPGGAELLREHCRQSLARYKVPARIEFVPP